MRTTLVFVAAILTGVLSTDSQNVLQKSSATPLEVEPGFDLPLSIMTLTDNVVGCYLDTPNQGTVEFKPEIKAGSRFVLSEDTIFSKCQVTVKDLEVADNGVWRLYSVNADGSTKDSSFDITVKSTDTSDEADANSDGQNQEESNEEAKEEPSVEETIEVIDLDSQTHTIGLNDDVVRVVIEMVGYRENDECHLKTPDGQEYNLTDGINIPGVVQLQDSKISCGVEISVSSEEFVGDWLLSARESSMGSHIVEKRLPFTIHVEEPVTTHPSGEVHIAQGSDFYIRLEQAIDEPDSCAIVSPNDISRVEKDDDYANYCGFIVRHVAAADAGGYKITYGSKIVYYGYVVLVVDDVSSITVPSSDETLTLTKNKPAEVTLGADDVVYCKLEDPSGVTMFEGFSKCQLSLQRATVEHAGHWKMFVATSGRVVTQEYRVTINVIDSASKPIVTHSVEKIDRVVYMTCSVTPTTQVKACKFRDPWGKILMANPGVGEDRYTFYGSGDNFNTGVYSHECGLRITEPATSDLGIWRCAIETEEDTHYGFLTVLCPWAMQDPVIAASVPKEPVLAADRTAVSIVEGDDATLSCRVAASIRYCHFRSANGSAYPVGPETSGHNYKYVGAGFEAGECSIKLQALSVQDSGRWSCVVGFHDAHAPEQRADVQLSVEEKMSVQQFFEGSQLLVVGHVSGRQPLEYCRFVRIDALGFTSEVLPEGFSTYGSMAAGECGLRVHNPNILDQHPWTVVAKISGHDEEIFKQTEHSIPTGPDDHHHGNTRGGNMHFFYCFILPLMIVLFVVGAVAASRRSRQWTKERAFIVRDSFRRSFSRSFSREAVITEKPTAIITEKPVMAA